VKTFAAWGVSRNTAATRFYVGRIVYDDGKFFGYEYHQSAPERRAFFRTKGAATEKAAELNRSGERPRMPLEDAPCQRT
jgi:hypothetical protein